MVFLYSLYILHENDIKKMGVREVAFLVTAGVIDLVLLPLELLILMVIWLYCKVKKYYK